MKQLNLNFVLGVGFIIFSALCSMNCISIPDNVSDLIPGGGKEILDEETIIAGLKEALDLEL